MKITLNNYLINKEFLQGILPFPKYFLVSSMLSVCAVIGAWISGFFILYLIAMGIFFLAYFYEAYRLSEKFDIAEQAVNDEKAYSQSIAEKEISGKLLQDALEKAREGERLKTAFLNNLSHEIRTPLNAIVGYSAFLKEQGQSAERIDHITGVIQESSDKLVETINDLLNISSIESGKIEIKSSETDIGNIIINTIEKNRKQASLKGIEIFYSIDAEPSDLLAMTDGDKLGHVLNHIIDNAVKFSDAGRVIVKCSKKGDGIQICVSDSGPGIASSIRDKVFEPFFQADPESSVTKGGLGIGLSIARAFVKALGGSIWHKPKSGSGTDFFLDIPLNSFKTELLEGEKMLPAAAAAKKKKILVAEDEECNFLLIKEVLSSIDLTIYHAWNGKQAIELVKNHPDIDLVLMDIKMPVVAGCEATRQIKKMRPGLKVIAVTAHALRGDRERVMECGCDDYISKPVPNKTLVKFVRKYLEN